MMGPETDPDARAQIDASFSAGFYDGHPEVRYYHKDGSSFWAIIFQGPALDAGWQCHAPLRIVYRRHRSQARRSVTSDCC